LFDGRSIGSAAHDRLRLNRNIGLGQGIPQPVVYTPGHLGLSRVVPVGDRGMITSSRIRDELKPARLDAVRSWPDRGS
jgi:hypothetical protein